MGRSATATVGMSRLGDRAEGRVFAVADGPHPPDHGSLDALPQIPPVPNGQPVAGRAPNENQVALDLLSRYLDQQTAGARLATACDVASGARPDPDAMRARVTRFLKQE